MGVDPLAVIFVPPFVGIFYGFGIIASILFAFLSKSFKSSLDAKTSLSRDWAGAFLLRSLVFFGCLVWPLSIVTILVYRASCKYLHTPGYTCCGLTRVKRTPCPQQAPRSDGQDLEAGVNAIPPLPQNSDISVPPPVQNESMELAPIARKKSTVAAAPPPYQQWGV